MKYICITEVDATSGVLCTEEPMRTGPMIPQIKGLQIYWNDESTWPVPCNADGSYSRAPKYYGICDADADTTMPGVLEVISEAEWAQRKRDEFYARQPYSSWVFDETTMSWSSPIPYPDNGKPYRWDEATTSWIELTPP